MKTIYINGMTLDQTKFFNELAEIRRDLHQNPGIAYQESYASEVVCTKLSEWGIEHEAGWGYKAGNGGYGVVATITGKHGTNGKSIGLRADMDALPITEQSTHNWPSTNDGFMHACGHDGHTTMLLGAARQLSQNPDFKGTLKLIFQPAEEGQKGAAQMIEEGLFKKHPVDSIYGLHNWPSLPLGEVAIHDREVMAASDYYKIDIQGRSSHVGHVEQSIDASMLAAMVKLQLPKSHKNGKAQSWRIVETTHMTSGAANSLATIPETARLQGTVRTFDADVAREVEHQMRFIVNEIMSEYNATATVEYNKGSIVTKNNPDEAKFMTRVAQDVLGTSNVHAHATPELTAEDFGFMLQEVPGCYFWLGQGEANNPESPHNRPLHNNAYDFNDSIIPHGVKLFSAIVKQKLSFS